MQLNRIKYYAVIFLMMISLKMISPAHANNLTDHYPLICNLNIGGPAAYDKPDTISKLAKADVTLIGFYRTWESDRNRFPGAMRSTVQKIKAQHPEILIGQYTVLNEAPENTEIGPDSDKAQKITEMDWWIKGLIGQKLQWTTQYGKYDVNFTLYSRPDTAGMRYPNWLAARDYNVFFKKVPELDIWYLDNVVENPKISFANWDPDGANQLQPASSVQAIYRAGHVAEWYSIRSLNPNILLVGNVDQMAYKTPEYSGQLNGAVLEALMGLQWSTEKLKGWTVMMQRYHDTFAHLRQPKLVIFNVHGRLNNYQLMRFGLTSALLNNGIFSYSELNGNYRSIPWFDEFDADLGKPLEGPQLSAWQNGVYRREFEKGVVFVNPGNKPVTVANELNLVRLNGIQAPNVNNGRLEGASLTLPARDGLILLKVQ